MYERGPYAKGIERREAILKATLEVFSQSGYRGTSLRAIARELKIGPTLIQHYFTSREELLTEVIAAWDAENDRLEAGLPMVDAFLHGIEHNVSIPGLIHLYTAFAVEATDPDHPARPFFEERYARMTAGFIADLQNRQREGSVSKELDPEHTARVLIATCEGLQVRWLHDPTFDMYLEFIRVLHSLGVIPSVDYVAPRRSEATID